MAFNAPQIKPQGAAAPVHFRGRNRADAKRKALNYWYVNQARLGLSLRDFSGRCRLLDDERTILFYDPKP